jgi:hypothetical protein
MARIEPLPTDRLAELIAAKEQVLELLASLARRQLTLAQSGDMAALLKLLAAKQTVLSQLQALQQKLEPFQNEDPEHRVWRSSQHRQAAQRAASRCEALLAETMRLESQGEAAMVVRRDTAARELAGLHAASDVHSAYTFVPAAARARLQCEG